MGMEGREEELEIQQETLVNISNILFPTTF